MRGRAVPWTVLLAASLVVGDARAQCGANRSSCTGCHDGGRAASAEHDPWHDDHVFADLCPICHGGDGQATSADAAHLAMTPPLAAVDGTCVPCHGAATTAFVERYRSRLAARGGPHAAAARSVPGGPASSPPGPIAPPPHGASGPNLVMGLLVGLLGAVGGAFVVQRERARGRQAPPSVAEPMPQTEEEE